MNLLEKMKLLLLQKQQQQKEPDKEQRRPDFWIETSDSISHKCRFDTDGRLAVKVVDDSRPAVNRIVESFLNKFFPSGYPYSVNEGYLTYTKFRALQHVLSAALSVLSTQLHLLSRTSTLKLDDAF